MRIVYVHQYFATRDSATCTRSYEFALRLIKKGYSVTVITSGAQLRRDDHTGRTRRESFDGIDVIVLPVDYVNEMGYGARIWSFIRFALLASWYAAREPSDIVVALSTPLTVAIPAIVGKVVRRVPMIFEVGDLWPEMPIAIGVLKNPVAKALAKALEWCAYHAADHVIAFSPGMADGVRRRGISQNRVSVIPNGADLDLFQSERTKGESIRDALGVAKDDPIVLYAGSFGWIYGVEFLAAVAERLEARIPGARVLVVGTGLGKQELLAEGRERGVLGRSLTVWDPLPKDRMPQLFSACDVVLSIMKPIRAGWVNSANKFFDGLAAGRPLAINYGGWQADLLKSSCAGIAVPDASPVSFADAVAELLLDRDRLATAGANARAVAVERFARDDLAEQFRKVLEGAVRKQQEAVRV